MPDCNPDPARWLEECPFPLSRWNVIYQQSLWDVGAAWWFLRSFRLSQTFDMFVAVVTSRLPLMCCVLFVLKDSWGPNEHPCCSSGWLYYPEIWYSCTIYVQKSRHLRVCLHICIALVQWCLNYLCVPKRRCDWQRAPEWSGCEQVCSIIANAFSLNCWLSSTHLSADQ